MTGQKPLYYLSIREARQLIQSRALSPVELTRAFLERIESVDGQLHAYVKLMADRALAEARAAEEEIGKGNYRGPLHGIPLAVKDQLDVEGAPAQIRNRDANGARATKDAAAVRKLREAGAVVLGKLAMSGLPGNPPQPRNPWNLEHITGGSSTGAGAGVAAGLCMGALGEDTAGSIRNPAAYCGLVGLKATFGRVSRRGLAPLSYTLDHCGPMAWLVEDAADMLQAIAGYDPDDPTSGHAPVSDYSAALREDIKHLVVGVPRAYIQACRERLHPEVLPGFEESLGVFESLGARIEDVTLPTLQFATIANAMIYYNEYFAGHKNEAQAVLTDGAAQRRARIFLGLLTGAADYIQAQRIRARVKREFEEAFRKVDIMALPCVLGPAPTFKELGELDTLYKHLAPEFHGAFNLAGLPVISIPCGFFRSDLPAALQLAAKPFDEGTLLRAAFAFQQRVKFYERRPPI